MFLIEMPLCFIVFPLLAALVVKGGTGAKIGFALLAAVFSFVGDAACAIPILGLSGVIGATGGGLIAMLIAATATGKQCLHLGVLEENVVHANARVWLFPLGIQQTRKAAKGWHWKSGALVAAVLLLLTCAPPGLAQVPSITAITNAAIPAIDYPLSGPVVLATRSIATIFGTNLADAPVSTAPPWPTVLGGVEVHFVPSQCILNIAAPCDIPLGLIYVSPTQINFVTPDFASIDTARVVLIRNGVRYDSLGEQSQFIVVNGVGPLLFEVGSDCLFSTSLTGPTSCGFSPTRNDPNQVLIGAVTDVLGNLITSQNPIRPGQVITLWGTGVRIAGIPCSDSFPSQCAAVILEYIVCNRQLPGRWPNRLFCHVLHGEQALCNRSAFDQRSWIDLRPSRLAQRPIRLGPNRAL